MKAMRYLIMKEKKSSLMQTLMRGPAKMLIEIRKMSHRCLTETEMDQPDHYVSLLWKP